MAQDAVEPAIERGEALALSVLKKKDDEADPLGNRIRASYTFPNFSPTG